MLLPNPDFKNWLQKSIKAAGKSIVMVNYLATMNADKGAGIIEDVAQNLVFAAKRGVSVNVVLEGSKFHENLNFYTFLKRGGASVWMDTSLTFIHTKAILIDDQFLCIGSHNLSSGALLRHEEMSFVTSDEAAIARFHKEFEKMTAQRKEISKNICKEGTLIPVDMISGADAPLTKIKRVCAPYAYLLYLLFCKIDGGKPGLIKIDAENWTKELGFKKSTASPDVQVRSVLEMMDKKLGVVKHDQTKNTVLRISPLTLRPLPLASILIPTSFWHFNWHQHLSVDAIHLYLAGEAEKLWGPFAPWWRMKRDDIAKKYGFQKQLVGRAQTELKKFDLLEILFETAGLLPAGRYARYMNYFRQNPFYDYDARMAEIDQMTEKYPAKDFSQAQKLLSLIGNCMNVEELDFVCRSITNLSPTKTDDIITEVKNLSPNSTKRTFEYIEERLMAKG